MFYSLVSLMSGDGREENACSAVTVLGTRVLVLLPEAIFSKLRKPR